MVSVLLHSGRLMVPWKTYSGEVVLNPAKRWGRFFREEGTLECDKGSPKDVLKSIEFETRPCGLFLRTAGHRPTRS